MKMAGTPPTKTHFTIGDVFRAGDDVTIRGLQFAMAVQQFATLARFLRRTTGDEAIQDADSRQTLLVGLVSTKEAADLFRKADKAGSFEQVEGASQQLAEDLQLLRRECDKGSGSLYQSVLYELRHRVAHWKLEAVRAALSRIADRRVPVWIGGESYMTSTIPLFGLLAGAVASIEGDQGLLPEDRQRESIETSQRLAKVQGAMMRTAEAFYTMSLVKAGVLRPG